LLFAGFALPLQSVPPTLAKAVQLEFLTLTQNRLTTLPEELADLHSVSCHVMVVAVAMAVEATAVGVVVLVTRLSDHMQRRARHRAVLHPVSHPHHTTA
jgi:hypothetical protein